MLPLERVLAAAAVMAESTSLSLGFGRGEASLSLGVHEESLEVWVQVGDQGAHEVIHGGALLQHPCRQRQGQPAPAPQTTGRHGGGSHSGDIRPAL